VISTWVVLTVAGNATSRSTAELPVTVVRIGHATCGGQDPYRLDVARLWRHHVTLPRRCTRLGGVTRLGRGGRRREHPRQCGERYRQHGRQVKHVKVCGATAPFGSQTAHVLPFRQRLSDRAQNSAIQQNVSFGVADRKQPRIN
jgi:hypothetical protein